MNPVEIQEELDMIAVSNCATLHAHQVGEHTGYFPSCTHPICKRTRRAINAICPSNAPLYPVDVGRVLEMRRRDDGGSLGEQIRAVESDKRPWGDH